MTVHNGVSGIILQLHSSGDATPGRARSKIHRPGSALPIALLCFGNSVNRKVKILPYLTR